MASLFQLERTIIPITGEMAFKEGASYLEIVDTNEMPNERAGYEGRHELVSSLLKEPSCSLTVTPHSMIGSFVVLDKDDVLKPKAIFVFELFAHKLLIIDDSTSVAQAVAGMQTIEAREPLTPARNLLMIIRSFVKEDATFLTKIEEELERMEEDILSSNSKLNSHEMIQVRRRIFALNTYYEQLADVIDTISDDEIEILDDSDEGLFDTFAQQVDRLFDRSKSLREYNLQLRELYQMQTDTQLNKTMRVLTVIATIFIPLTFITSWYGMNFNNMSELEWEYGYIGVIVICIVIIVAELVYFRKKKWL